MTLGGGQLPLHGLLIAYTCLFFLIARVIDLPIAFLYTAVDGASFSLPDRGPCRCIKAELVCAKSRSRQEPKAGLFLCLFLCMKSSYGCVC